MHRLTVNTPLKEYDYPFDINDDIGLEQVIENAKHVHPNWTSMVIILTRGQDNAS